MRIAIVNDMAMAVEALRRAIALTGDHTIAWTAADGREAVAACIRDTPDLILMDLVMPGMDGVAATRAIMAKTPCPILIVTVSVETNAARVFEAMGFGALDAVDTPALGTGDLSLTSLPLLRKIADIGALADGAAKLGVVARAAAKPARSGLPLVAVGASAGGPAALATLLGKLPVDFPASLLMVQHVDERFTAGMAAWLNDQSPLPVRVAQEGDRPRAATALLAGTGDHLVLKDGGVIGYTPEPRTLVYRPSIDVFFQSLIKKWPGPVVGVLLTGMGSDGAVGLKALRGAGHHTIAQDRATSAVYGMPKAAAALDAAVEILPIAEIAPQPDGAPGERGAEGEDQAMSNAESLPLPPAPAAAPAEAITVFLVDDQAMVGEAVRRAILDEPGIRFHYCGDPSAAVATARRVKPSVILQDLVMPGANGLDLVRLYRADAELARVPIIVLSTREEPTVKRDAFALGANDYLVKLPDRIELIARIRYHSAAYLTQLQRDEAYRALRASEQKLIESNRELERLTNVDGLTGLSNRRYFNEYMDAEWKRSVRAKTPLSVLMIDVDHFKLYNDTYGHLGGDDVLKRVAEAIKGCFKRSTDLAARYGGEEFAVILPSRPEEDLQFLADAVCDAVEALAIPHAASSVGSYVTVSVGGATTIPDRSDSYFALVGSADKALYASKKAGRNRATFARVATATPSETR